MPEEWFWEILHEFKSREMRASYLKFVNAKSRLPSDLTSIKHIYTYDADAKQAIDSLPKSHTCTFQVDLP